MLTTQECVMTKILDCGTADLSLLDDINYDLDDIIDSLMENNCLSLNGIFQEVFIKGAEELQEEFENQKEDILNHHTSKGFKLVKTYQIDNWCASLLQK